MTTPPTACGPRVLVIDDDPGVRDVLASMLASLGIAVARAADGVEGLAELAATRPSAPFDLVFVDVMTPGWDGPTALARLNQTNLRVRCCFVTGDTGRYTQADLLGLAGAVRLLPKPFRRPELIAALAAVGIPTAGDVSTGAAPAP